MTHRTFTINNVLFNVFESHAGAQRFMSQQEGDYSVVVRGRTFSARRGDTYLTVNLTSTAKPEHGHIMEAARAVAAEIDKMITAEKAPWMDPDFEPHHYYRSLLAKNVSPAGRRCIEAETTPYIAPASDPA